MRKLGLGIVVALSATSSCLAPTEITLVLSTDVPCASIRGTAIAIGAPGDDKTGIATSVQRCSDDGGIGTLVVVPSGSIDDSVAVRVMLGMQSDPETCKEPDFTGCVVARRALRYVPHHPLTLPIELSGACVNQPCDPNTSCVDGTCVP